MIKANMIKSNYHCHCNRCLHADGTEEDFVKSAINYGLDIIGISDHAPFFDEDYGYRMRYDELDEYFGTIDKLKEKYQDKITVLKSLEIEYMPRYEAYYEMLWEEKKVDYLLLGEHFYFNAKGENHNTFYAKDTDQCVEYANMVKVAAKRGYFNMLAHPDLFMINDFGWDTKCDKAADIIIQAAEDTGLVLELNANGIRRGLGDFPDGERYPYPHNKFWEKVAKSKAKVIVGADSHRPVEIWDASVEKAFVYLRDMGITPLEKIEL